MDFLIFQLRAPLAAWGEPATGEYRATHTYPGESALIGLLGAALGLRRGDEEAHAALGRGYGFAVAVRSSGTLLRDYHTAQVPSRTLLKGRTHATRRDELALPRHALKTIQSIRDYRQSAACLVVVQAHPGAPYSLAHLGQSLRRPRFFLYLGRKCCPPSAPLDPRVVPAESALAAINAYLAEAGQQAERETAANAGKPVQFAWSDTVTAGIEADFSVLRKDRMIRRNSWQFGDRSEHIKLFDGA